METKDEVDEVRAMVNAAKVEITDVITRLLRSLPSGYIVTDCRVITVRADLMGGGSQVFIDGCDITVEVAL